MQFARLDISLFRENWENGSELLIFLEHSDNTQHKKHTYNAKDSQSQL